MAEMRVSFDFSKIWEILLKIIGSPSFITMIAPFLVGILGRWFPNLDPAFLNGLIQLLVQILPLIFAAEMGTRYVMGSLERSAKIRAAWTPDASGKLTVPPPKL